MVAGLVSGVLATGFFVSAEAGGVDGHVHGPDTHTHGPDGEYVGVSRAEPERPPVAERLLPLRETSGRIVTSADGKFEAWIDEAANTAFRAKWVATGGDLADGPTLDPSVDDWWFLPPDDHFLDPRWWVLYGSVG